MTPYSYRPVSDIDILLIPSSLHSAVSECQCFEFVVQVIAYLDSMRLISLGFIRHRALRRYPGPELNTLFCVY